MKSQTLQEYINNIIIEFNNDIPEYSNIPNQIHNYWNNVSKGKTNLGKSMVYSVHGKDLSSKSFAKVKNILIDEFAKFIPIDVSFSFESKNYSYECAKIEAENSEKIVQIASDAVCNTFNFPDTSLIAEMIDKTKPQNNQRFDVDSNDTWESSEKEIKKNWKITKNDREEINRRFVLNGISHGAATYYMLYMYRDLKDQIDSIDKILYSSYGFPNAHTFFSYWLSSMSGSVEKCKNNNKKNILGSSKVDYDSGKPIAIAKGYNLTVIIHEAVKAIFEICSHHQFSQIEENNHEKIIKCADNFFYEAPLIQTGLELYTKILDHVIDDSMIPEFITDIATMPANKFESKIDSIIS